MKYGFMSNAMKQAYEQGFIDGVRLVEKMNRVCGTTPSKERLEYGKSIDTRDGGYDLAGELASLSEETLDELSRAGRAAIEAAVKAQAKQGPL